MRESVKVAFVCVNYYCESAIAEMLRTVAVPPDVELCVTVVDNSQSLRSDETFASIQNEIGASVIDPGRNLGYLGAFAFAVHRESLADNHDMVILANPDLELSDDFFAILCAKEYDDDIVVIAPDIVNLPSGSPANPAMIQRPSRRRMWLRKLVHANEFIYSVYDLLHRLKKHLRRRRPPLPRSERIYAPHGAMMIFLRSYFEAGGSLDYFGFLFGEEIFVAEEARRINKTIFFDPYLQARHREHVSTGVLGRSNLSKYAHQSLKQIYDRYFRESL